MVWLSPRSPGPGHNKAESMGVLGRDRSPSGPLPVALVVESACHGECRLFVLFAGVALSEKSPYLGGGSGA